MIHLTAVTDCVSSSRTALYRLAGGLTFAFAFVACGGSEKSPEPKEPAADSSSVSNKNARTFSSEQVTHGDVKWAAVVADSGTATVEIPAQLVLNDDRTSRVSAPAGGRVASVHVKPGDRVSPGQALVTLHSSDASTARADVIKANAEFASRKAAATYAKSARDRAERLLNAKAASRQDVERARADDELAQAMLTQSQAEIDRANATVNQLGATATGDMVLTSPIAGVIIAREAAPGSVVNAGALLMTVSDPSTLWLNISANESAASGVQTGSRIEFSVAATPGKVFEARVQSIGAALDSATRTVPIRALVENRNGAFRAATYATAWLHTAAPLSGFSVPDDAVQLLDEQTVVFVVRADGKGGATFERRNVTVGMKSGGKSLITRGLSAGDTVVTHGAFAVKSEFARGKMAEG